MSGKCPVCSNVELSEIQAGDIAIDVCESGCGGLWFDWKEIKKLDEPHEILPERVLHVQNRKSTQPPPGVVRQCPRCSQPMCRRYFDIKGQVEVDQCLKCSGIWLDVGEIQAIRAQYKTEAERLKAADQYLGVALKEHVDEMTADTAAKLRTTVSEVNRMANDDIIEPSRLTKLFRGLVRF